MTLQIKSRLLLSELEFVASCVDRGTLAWYFTDGGKLNIVARNGSMTIRSAVPLVDKDAKATFGAEVLVLSNIVRMGHNSIAQVGFNEFITVGMCSVCPFVGPPHSWVFDTTTCSTQCLVSAKALRDAVVAAKRFISTFKHGKYSGSGIGLILQNGQLMVNAIRTDCIFEQSMNSASSSECFRTYIPKHCLKAILNIGFGATTPVQIEVLENRVQFCCGPRTVVIQGVHNDLFTIDEAARSLPFKPRFAVGAADFRDAIVRLCTARREGKSVMMTTTNNAVFMELPFVEDDHVLSADEEVTAQCWNELSICVNPHMLRKFLKDVDGVVYVFGAVDKSRLLLGTATTHLLLTGKRMC
jgi:hypothetical protein